MIVTWHIEGAGLRRITATGAGVQEAFARLTPGERATITVFCTHVTTEQGA